MIRGLYLHRESPLHRLPAGSKLLALPIIGTALFLLPSPVLALAALVGVLLTFLLARFSVAVAFAQIRALLPILALILLAQLVLADPAAALLAVLRLAALFLAASLVTLTSRTSDVTQALQRAMQPLRPLGADPDKIGLALSLTLRFIPAVAGVVAEIREAQAARGLERNVLRLAVPVIVRLLKTSDEIAEAIDARS